MRYSEPNTKSSLLTISLSVRVKRFPLNPCGTKGAGSAERQREAAWAWASGTHGPPHTHNTQALRQEGRQRIRKAQMSPRAASAWAECAANPPAVGGQSCCGWRGLRPHHQSPKGQWNPTPPSPALPLRLLGGDCGWQEASVTQVSRLGLS